MSSPARLPFSPADLLARWMPSSTRAGVILDTDFSGTLRSVAAAGSSNLQPDDSFTSDFAPLPASVDSSCLGVGGEQTGTVHGLSTGPTGLYREHELLGGMEAEPQDLPLIMKLEQLKKWQQHMQEQLKAHQLEELLHFQEEQQRLLGNVKGLQNRKDPAESSDMSEPDWPEDSLQRESRNRSVCAQDHQLEEPSSADRHRQLPRVQDAAKEEDMWSSGDEPEDDPAEAKFHMITQQNCVTATNEKNSQTLNEDFHDRPIKPGIGVQKKTFEDLLEEQLRLEEQRLKASKQQQPAREGAEAVPAAPKRTFLKRGQGLARFMKYSKASSPKIDQGLKRQPQARVISRSNPEPASILKVNAPNVPRLTAQHKTATLNKENRLRGLRVPPPETRAESRAVGTKILGGRQEQNTECSLADTEGRASKPHHLGWNKKTAGLSLQPVRNDVHIIHPNPVTQQVVLLDSQGTAAENEPPQKKGLHPKATLTTTQENSKEEATAPLELSFQEKLRRFEFDRQQESADLGEFELLEQAAEELSFSSNSSFVVKVLQMDRLRWRAAMGLHQRRLSSTPRKSPPRGVPKRCSSVGDSCVLASQSSSGNSEALGEQMGADTRKMADISGDMDEQNSEKDKPGHCDVPSSGGSEFGDGEAAIKSTICFPAHSNTPYDKRSYQDEDSFRDSASDGGPDDHRNDEESDSVISNADESTLNEDEDDRPGGVVFDDDDTWNDPEDSDLGRVRDTKDEHSVSKFTGKTVSPPETLVRKVAVICEEDPTPASKLMNKFFPSLKPKARNAPPPPAPTVTPGDKSPTEDTGKQGQSLQLRERLAELEIEIERFKKENSALVRLRQENEKFQENLRRERSEFERTKAEDAAKFEEYKREETKKLQKERKLFETHVLTTRALPDKKEREEMQALKQQLNSTQEELKRRDIRWTSTHNRLRQQIDSLSQENSSLRDEIHVLEKLRLSAWKKAAATEKESPRVFENVPAATKGVTFASPLDSRESSSPPQTGVATGARRPSRETSQPAAAGKKSSLRKPAGPGPCSSSVPSRSSAPANKSWETPPQQEQTHNSPKRDVPKAEPGCSDIKEQESAKETITHPDGKVEKVLANGDRVILFPNGTRKEVSADGESVKVTFFNGDTKEVTADQRVTYYYTDAQTTHITYPDGMEVLHFPNNQTEKHFPDGRKEITFPDQTVKNLFPNGREESVLTDGTIIQVNPDGTKEIHFNTGQKEIHTADYKRREYPDGTVKTVYTDGRQETRYPTGRVRIKDKDGNVVLDNMA